MSLVTNFFYIGLGGALGAISRYGCGLLISHIVISEMPYGTLFVNVLGSFIIGILASYFSAYHGTTHPLALFLMVGFLGAFTTFSSFSLETLNLFLNEQAGLAILNIILNLVLCMTFVTLGVYIPVLLGNTRF